MLSTRQRPMTDSKPPTTGGSQKQQLNMRLTQHARNLLVRLASSRGVSQTDIVEMLIREEAERRGIVRISPASPT